MRDFSSIVLASGSPRRLELLASLGLDVRVVPSGLAEDECLALDSRGLAAYYASAKAERVAAREPGAIIVAADTVVDLDGITFGKPRDSADASAMLRRLSGREHIVFSAYCVIDGPTGLRLDASAATRVQFATLAPQTIAAYVESGDPLDKAGAYGIQGRGAALVERIDGDFYTVMGFPVGDFIRRLPELGLRLPVRAALEVSA